MFGYIINIKLTWVIAFDVLNCTLQCLLAPASTEDNYNGNVSFIIMQIG